MEFSYYLYLVYHWDGKTYKNKITQVKKGDSFKCKDCGLEQNSLIMLPTDDFNTMSIRLCEHAVCYFRLKNR